MRRIRKWSIVGLLLGAMGCNGGTEHSGVAGGGALGDVTPVGELQEAQFIETSRYCWAPRVSPEPTDVQVLIDASGSMAGHRSSAPQLLSWIKQAVSQMEGAYLQRGDYRAAQFAEGRGIFNGAGWNEVPAPLSSRGNTNLHEAIAAAEGYGLTFIVTDGVAAAGVGAGGACPGGVDAACVAEVLRQRVHDAPSSGGADWGAWLLPVVVPFDGTFYTEQFVDPQNFNPQGAVEAVQAEMGDQVVITNPRPDPTGRLAFNYRGPRTLLLMVLARQAEVGRGAVLSLWENMRAAGVGASSGLSQVVTSGRPITALRPIEVYPGFMPEPTFGNIREEASDPEAFSGALSVSASGTGNPRRVEVECIPERGAPVATGVYALEVATNQGSGGCVDIGVLPAFAEGLEAAGTSHETMLDGVIAGYKRDGDVLKLALACQPDALPDCASGEAAAAQWVTNVQYRPAADCLERGATCEGAFFDDIRALSTEEPSRQPHRVFALDELLKLFLRSVSSDQRRVRHAQFNFCRP